jgi:hypothetical protein
MLCSDVTSGFLCSERCSSKDDIVIQTTQEL